LRPDGEREMDKKSVSDFGQADVRFAANRIKRTFAKSPMSVVDGGLLTRKTTARPTVTRRHAWTSSTI
jgi:hypothetical protein